MSVRRRSFSLVTCLLVVALAAGCGGASSSAPPVTPATGGVSSPSGEATDLPTQPTPQEVPSQSPGPVTGSTELTAWMAKVCTAVGQTQLADSFRPDPTKIAKDPQAYAQQLATTYARLGTKLRTMADQLEQIGAPDIEHGQEFVDGYVDVARKMADALDRTSAKIPKNATLPQVIAVVSAANKGEFQQLLRQFKAVSELLDTDKLEALAETVPECKKLDID